MPDYFVAMLRNIRAMGEDYLHRIEVVGPKKSVLKRFIKKKILLPHNGSHLDQYFETI